MPKYLSGLSGFAILKDDQGKNIIVLSDIHSDLIYCKNQNYKPIDIFLKENMIDSQVILEEVERTGDKKLTSLWSSPHFESLKNLYLQNKKYIIPIDIRPFLVPFSWETIGIEREKGKITLGKYLHILKLFFKMDLKICKTVIKDLIQKKIKKRSGLCKHFNRIKDSFYKFLKELDENKILLDVNINILKKINDYLSYIMEWYSILIMFSTKKTSIIHAGLFHTNNIIKNLVSNYNFRITKKKGLNDYDDYIPEKVNGCILID